MALELDDELQPSSVSRTKLNLVVELFSKHFGRNWVKESGGKTNPVFLLTF
jgi:hypothetical protein